MQQGISIYSADKIFIVLNQFRTQISQLKETVLENKNTFWVKGLMHGFRQIGKFLDQILTADERGPALPEIKFIIP